MKRIDKSTEPGFWIEFRRKSKFRTYDELDETPEGREIRSKLRHALFTEQKGICCYCCSRLKETESHNEHFRPQSRYPQESLDYGNIFCSCNEGNTCGTMKADSTYRIVSPAEPTPESHFAYQLDGKIIGLDTIGEDTIKVLNLNYRPLMEKRAACLRECIGMAKYCGREYVMKYFMEPEEATGMLPRFTDMISYFLNEGLFDNAEILSGNKYSQPVKLKNN